MGTVFINNLIISGRHGVSDEERSQEQRFRVAAEVQLDTTQAEQSDELSDTYDYHPLKKMITEIIQGPPRHLIESIAREIADKVLTDKRVTHVKITIEKIDLWPPASGGVTIERSR